MDANGLEYSISWPRNSSFSVDRHSGLLRVAQPLDRETLAVHHFVILVTDGIKESTGGGFSGVHSATASVEVLILDVNDSPPLFLEPRPIASIAEDSTPGTIVMRLTAVSMDEGENAIVRYRLLETNTPEFALNSTTGELSITSLLLRFFAELEHIPYLGLVLSCFSNVSFLQTNDSSL